MIVWTLRDMFLFTELFANLLFARIWSGGNQRPWGLTCLISIHDQSSWCVETMLASVSSSIESLAFILMHCVIALEAWHLRLMFCMGWHGDCSCRPVSRVSKTSARLEPVVNIEREQFHAISACYNMLPWALHLTTWTVSNRGLQIAAARCIDRAFLYEPSDSARY